MRTRGEVPVTETRVAKTALVAVAHRRGGRRPRVGISVIAPPCEFGDSPATAVSGVPRASNSGVCFRVCRHTRIPRWTLEYGAPGDRRASDDVGWHQERWPAHVVTLDPAAVSCAWGDRLARTRGLTTRTSPLPTRSRLHRDRLLGRTHRPLCGRVEDRDGCGLPPWARDRLVPWSPPEESIAGVEGAPANGARPSATVSHPRPGGGLPPVRALRRPSIRVSPISTNSPRKRAIYE